MAKKPIEEIADFHIFDRDPEEWDEEAIKAAEERLKEIIPKLRARRTKLEEKKDEAGSETEVD